jgi:tetratricopeptide (TPR) repeat protein
LAFQHAEKNRHDLAIEAYRQALDFNPDDRLARISLGWLLYCQGRWSEAIDEHRLALEQEVGADAQFALGLVYLANGNCKEAQTTYAEGIRLFGGQRDRGSAHCKT